MGKKSRTKQLVREERAFTQDLFQTLERYKLDPRDFAPWGQEHQQAITLTMMLAKAAYVALKAYEANPGIEGLISAVRSLNSSTDTELDAMPKTTRTTDGTVRTLACKPGCSFCCTIRVTTCVPVILSIADYISKKKSEVEVQALLERMDSWEREGEGLSPIERVYSTRMCPLMVDGLCSVHFVRPTGCRTYHSFDVTACEAELADPAKDIQPPIYPPRHMVRFFITEASNMVMSGLGLDNLEVELVPALRIALTVPDAGTRYLAGDDLFKKAHMKDVTQAQADNSVRFAKKFREELRMSGVPTKDR